MSDDDKKGFTPITTPEQLNAFLTDRVKRAEAKAVEKFSDYDDLKAKAARLDALEQDKKSAEEKLTDRIAGLEAELTKTREDLGKSAQEATRARIQAKYKVSDDDAELFLTASDAEGLEKQAKAIADRIADRKAKGPVVTAQKGGEQQDPKADPMRELADALFPDSD